MIRGERIASFIAFYLPWPGRLQAIVPPRAFSKAYNKEPTSGPEPLYCSLRVRFVSLSLRRKAAYVRRKRFVTYRRLTLNYAQVSVSCYPTGGIPFTALPTPEPTFG